VIRRSRAGPAYRCLAALCVLTVLHGCVTRAARVQREFDPRTGTERIEVAHPGFTLRLAPLNPDYVVAVFTARGLPREVAEATRGYCTFGTTIRNTGREPLHYRLTDWRYVTPDGKVHRIKTKTAWLEEWRRRGVPFRWLLLHEEQTYQPGDWGQGFTTVALPPGSRFDLYYSWTQGEEHHEGRITGVRCAPARLPAP